MPTITGELSPSPPISPSPAPTMKTRSSTSKVNCMLDVNRMASPAPPQSTAQKTSLEHPATTTATPHHENTEQTHNTAQGTKAPTRPANNRLPRFNQVMEMASLQAPISMNRPVQKDPLDKYSRGITTIIHDAYPSSAYARIKQEVIDEWTTVEGETLLAIPFGSDAETPELHNNVGDRIFDAVGEITQSETYGVASPMKEEDLKEIIAKLHHQNAGQKRKRTGEPPAERLPATFLIHTLSPVHYQILTQQTVWASQNITFRVAPPEMKCPTILFSIKGLRSNSPVPVTKCIQDTWCGGSYPAVVHVGSRHVPPMYRFRATMAKSMDNSSGSRFKVSEKREPWMETQRECCDSQDER